MDEQADLSDFGLGSMLRLVPALRDLSAECASVEQFAQRMSEFLHAAFIDHEGRPQTALVRVYGTAVLKDLPAEEQAYVARTTPAAPGRTTCLTLLGTAGALPAWQDRTRSIGHRVIPLRDAASVANLPMIAALLTQLGIDIEALVEARADIVLPVQDDRYRVFHVPDAVGSPVIPAQDFVAEHGIASALGFGGGLPGGEMYAVVLFSTVPVPLSAAMLFGTVALSTSLAAVDMLDLPLFSESAPARRAGGRRRIVSQAQRDRARYELTQALLRTHEQVALVEADRAALALERATYDAGRAAAIAAVALQLGSVRLVEDITELVVRDGLPILGATGASLALNEDDGRNARLYVSRGFAEEVRQKYTRLPLDDAVPTTLTARTGEPVYVSARAEGTARFPALAPMYEDTGLEALASLPLVVDDRLLGCITLTWANPTVFTPAATELMHALAAQAAQAVDRVRLLDVERDHSATLQRSFLTRPNSPTDLEIEVRYQPAAQHAQIGGDWYDAFVGPDGATVIAVGDVVGHDMLAAAVMGQMRNLLRGIVFSRPGSPAATLQYLEAAMTGLELENSATLLLASLSPAAEDGHRVLEWCNAGHPPPLLLDAGAGAVEILNPEPDLMIGVQPGALRDVHRRPLGPGSLLLLYTDGLIERRGEDLHEGISRLAQALELHSADSLDVVADQVLMLTAGSREDDAAVLVLRVPPLGAHAGGAEEATAATARDHIPRATADSVALQLPPEPSSAAAARRAVRAFLTARGRDAWRDAAELAVTELVTNAVLHAHTRIDLRLRCSDELRVEVQDASDVMPSQLSYGTSATTGRGMAMVAAVTAAHGVIPVVGGGKIVWFTVSDEVRPEPELDDLLDAWDDEAPSLGREHHEQAEVTLVDFPPTLWLAAAQQHDAILRELSMFRATRGQALDDLVAADRARFTMRVALDRAVALARQQGRARSPLPAGHPSPLDVVPATVALKVPVAPDAAADFAVLQDVLDEGERLACGGQLLARPALPEVTAVRDWAAEQVVAQRAGQPPLPWPGTHDDRFATLVDGSVAEFDWDSSMVRDSERGAVAADDQNRIVAVSRPLATVLGWSVEDLVGRRVVAIVPPQFREAHVAGMTRHLTTGEAHALDVELRLPVLCADGRQIECTFFIQAHRSRSGRPAYVAWVSPLDG